MAAPRQKRAAREAPELAAAIRRMLRALVARSEAGDTEAMEQLRDLVPEAARCYRLGVRLAYRGPAGYSYGDLAQYLGVSRQAARQLAESEGEE